MKVKMKKRRILCPDCKTGEESFRLDPSSPVCPYYECYNGIRCNYYVPTKKKGIKKILYKIKRIFKKY